MSELVSDPANVDPVHNQLRPIDSVLQVSPEEIPMGSDPIKEPQAFYKWIEQRLEDNGVALIPPGNPGLYEPTEKMVFCGFDATDLQKTGTFGDRNETWGIQGWGFKSAARAAQTYGEWPIDSPVWYATHANNREKAPETPAIAVFDGGKMFRIANRDSARHEDEYEVADGQSLDVAAVAVFYLPKIEH